MNYPMPGCVRHPDRPTALACVRCHRPACPDCLREAAVGHQCVDCVREGQRSVRPVRTVAGARQQRPTPYVTYTLIALNVLAFAVTALQSRDVMNNDARSRLFYDWALVPQWVADGEVFRVIGSGFLHFGPIHLLVNMFALYIVGRDVEVILGRSRYLAVYFVAMLGGAAGVMALQPPTTATAGASGAIFGLFGAQAAILIKLKQSPGPVIAVILINVVISISIPGISLWGHMGGLAAGALASAGLLFTPTQEMDARQARTLGWIALAVVAVLTIAIIGVRVAQLS